MRANKTPDQVVEDTQMRRHEAKSKREPVEREIDLHIGKRLRRRRRLLNLTQVQLGEAVGVRFQQIQKYECGVNKPTAARLYRLASVLSVPITYFFEGLEGKVSIRASID